jgi:RimJ/RimL family protein N-acetyltransferase
MTISSSSRSLRANRPGHIVCLGPAWRSALNSHFRALAPSDRRLRFGLTLADAALDDYVERALLRAHRCVDILIGFVDSDEALLGVAHLARDASDEVELGLSVSSEARRRGIAGRLFDASTRLAQALGAGELVMDYLPENAAIIALARRAGMRFVAGPDGGRRARLRLERDAARSGRRASCDEGVRPSASRLSYPDARPSRQHIVESHAPTSIRASSSASAVGAQA